MSEVQFHISKEWLEEYYINLKLSTAQCANLIGCGEEVIRQRLIKFSIPRRKRNTPGIHNTGSDKYLNSDWLRHNYIDLKKSVAVMAKEVGCSPSTIRLQLTVVGVKLRSSSEANLGKKRSDDQKQRMSDIGKVRFAGDRNPMHGKLHREDTKRKIGAKSALRKGPLNPMTGKKHTPETIRKIKENHADLSGCKNPRWLGGKSFEPYCEKFTKHLKEHVRDSFNRKCVVCGASENNEKLAVHHVDYSKLQGCRGQRWALVPVCRTCHSKTNHNRWQWFSLLINYWAMDQEIDFNQDLHGSLSFERCTSTPLDTAL